MQWWGMQWRCVGGVGGGRPAGQCRHHADWVRDDGDVRGGPVGVVWIGCACGGGVGLGLKLHSRQRARENVLAKLRGRWLPAAVLLLAEVCLLFDCCLGMTDCRPAHPTGDQACTLPWLWLQPRTIGADAGHAKVELGEPHTNSHRLLTGSGSNLGWSGPLSGCHRNPGSAWRGAPQPNAEGMAEQQHQLPKVQRCS